MAWQEKAAQTELNRLIRSGGLTGPSNAVASRMNTRNLLNTARSSGSFSDMMSNQTLMEKTYAEGRQRLNSLAGQRIGGGDPTNGPLVQSMGQSKWSRTGAAHGTDSQWAWPKLHDPFEYWRERVWWFNMEDPEEQRQKITDWVRLCYSTHYLVPGLIDIYAKWPLQDIEFVHKDKKLVQFYEELFMDGLNYAEFLEDLSREYWTVGDVFALGSWNASIGSWEADELINPNDVVVAHSKALRSYQYHIKVPTELKKLIDTREPESEYRTLVELYPEIIQWARDDTEIPVSDILMKQMKFKTNPWSEHGSPILLRAFRMLMLEESLNSAQDAVADRLYSPLILATLGLPDVDEDGPWIPDYTELQALRDDIGLAMNADFRLMVYHHGLDIKNAFGRETMPRFDQDFMRVEGNILKVFGIGPALLQGGTAASGTYASSALNHELITNLLEGSTKKLTTFIQDRMRSVAQAQEFYEYDLIGGRRVPLMETVLEQDEDTGEERVVEKPKLAIPDIKFKQISLKDENVERQFIMALQQAGFPVSYGSMAVNLPIEFKDEVEAKKKEKIDMVIAEQQYKKDLFKRLLFENLDPPPELAQEYMTWLATEHPELMASPQAMALQQSLMMGDPSMGMPTQDVSSPPPSGDLNYPGNQPMDGMFGPQAMGEDGQPTGDSQNAPQESFDQRGGSITRAFIHDYYPEDEEPVDGEIVGVAGLHGPRLNLGHQIEASVEASVTDDDFSYDFDAVESSIKWVDDDGVDEAGHQVFAMDFGTPLQFKHRVVTKIPKGAKIARGAEEFKLSARTKTAMAFDKYSLDHNGDLEPGLPDEESIDMNNTADYTPEIDKPTAAKKRGRPRKVAVDDDFYGFEGEGDQSSHLTFEKDHEGDDGSSYNEDL